MAEQYDSEEEWSEAELFDVPENPSASRARLADTSEARSEPPGTRLPPERLSVSIRTSIKLPGDAMDNLAPSFGEEGLSEASRSPLEPARSNPPSPGVQAGVKRICTFGTPENTPRADKAAQEFPAPAASCPVTIAHYGKKQLIAVQPAADQAPSPDQVFMPPHELLAQTLPEYDADVARIGFRPGSVMEGAGRKLQGRDAVQFRRAIMRQTGFLENDERLGQSVPG